MYNRALKKLIYQNYFCNFFGNSSKFWRHFSTTHNSSTFNKVECKLKRVELKQRSLLKVSGENVLDYLQGLMTNDVTHLETKSSIYALFLNHQGRVLYDSIIYHFPQTNETLIECDSSLKSKFIKHLKLFRVKRKIEIEEEKEINLWVVFDAGHKYDFNNLIKNNNNNNNESNDRVDNKLLPPKYIEVESESCCGPFLDGFSIRREEFPLTLGKEARVVYDPRLGQLGWRILTPKSFDENKAFPQQVIEKSTEESYRELLYSLGVGEGQIDHPFGSSFPLESNGDYLHGISYQKGCYIGQELTARTHHTGVVRKRLMPFRLSENTKLPSDIDPSTVSLNDKKGKSLGKVRGISGSFGLALCRIEEVLNSSEIKLGNFKISIQKPIWWPIEVSKESRIGKS